MDLILWDNQRPMHFFKKVSVKKFKLSTINYIYKAKRAKMSVVSDIEIRQLLYLFQCFQEAQDDKVCETLCKLIDDQQSSMVILSNQILIPQEVTSLGFFLSRLQKQLLELNLQNCHIDDHGLNILHQFLCGDKVNKLRVDKIVLDGNNFTEASSPLIGDLIACLQLYHLSLYNNKITGVCDMCQAVIKTVKVLCMSNIGLTSLEAPAISVMITCLEVVLILDNNLGDDGAVILAKEI